MKNMFEHAHTERALLASLLKYPDLILDLDGKSASAAFQVPINKQLVDLLVGLYNEGFSKFDSDLVSTYLKMHSDQVAAVDVDRYIHGLFKAEANKENFKTYLKDLLDVHLKSKILTALNEHLHTIRTDGEIITADDLLGRIQSSFYQIESTKNEPEDDSDVCDGIEEEIMSRLGKGDENLGIPCGIGLIDDITAGWLPGKFYFVAARPKEGKSALLMQSAIHAAFFARKEKRSRVLYLDTEINKKEFRQRLISHVGAVDFMKILKGTWDDSEENLETIKRVLKFLERNKGILHHRYVPGFSTMKVMNLIRKYVYNYGVNMVIFDYIKEPSDVSDRKSYQKVTDLSYALKDTGGTLDIPILSALQQNRKGDGQSRTGGESFAESDGVLKAADIAFMLNKKTAKEKYEETLAAGTHRFQVYASRYTKQYYGGLNLRYYGYCFRFYAAAIQQLMETVEEDNAVQGDSLFDASVQKSFCNE